MYYKTLNEQSSSPNHASKAIFEECKFNVEDVVKQSQLDDRIDHHGKNQSYHQLLTTKTNEVQAVEDPDFPTISLKEAHKILHRLDKSDNKLNSTLEEINAHLSKKTTKGLLSCASKPRERISWQTVSKTLLENDDKKQILNVVENEIKHSGKGTYAEKLNVLHKLLNDTRIPQDLAKHGMIIEKGFKLAGGDLDNLQNPKDEHCSFTPNR